jgi:hypothetical protein
LGNARRKALELSGTDKKANKSKKQTTAEPSRAATAKPQAPVTIPQQQATGWNKITSKNKGKAKGKKGEKVSNELLGFGSGLNYNVLQNHDV